VYFEIADPLAWVTAAFNLTHARMEALEASDGNPKDRKNPIHPCDADKNLPKVDHFWWVPGHSIYEQNLRAHVDFEKSTPHLFDVRAEFQGAPHLRHRMHTAYVMSHFSQMNYMKATPKLGIDAPDWGWTLVGRSCTTKRKHHDRNDGTSSQDLAPGCSDHAVLYQEDASLECVLVFEGSNDIFDWFSNFDLAVDRFCGLGRTHRGFKNKLLRMMRGVDYRQVIRPLLPYCSALTVTGHSLGGAQAELFAACANKGLQEGDDGFEDHMYVSHEVRSPQKLPAFFSDKAQGAFVRNKLNGLCLDVRGTMTTDYDTDINMFECEFPDGNYSKDQKWRLTSDGHVVNSFSGHCMDVLAERNSSSGVALVQWPCSSGANQRYEITPEKFLRNVDSGKCVNSQMQLYPCPFTDQRWDMMPDGHIVNKLNGLCLDVAGSPRVHDGARIVVWPCEYDNTTAQLWRMNPEGVLENVRSDKCMVVVNQKGRENNPYLALGPCLRDVPEAGLLWHLAPEGFLKNRITGACIDVLGKPGLEAGAKVVMGLCEDQHIETTGLWTVMPDGFIRNVGSDPDHSQQCVTVIGDGPLYSQKGSAGASLGLAVCKTNTDQKWELTPDGFFKNVIGGRKCLALKRSDLLEAKPRLWLQNCEEPSDPAQFLDMKWERRPDGKLRSLDDFRCADVYGAPGTRVGTSLTSWYCETREGTDQRWILTPEGLLMNKLSSKCVDFAGGAFAKAGAPLVLGPCDGAAADVRWNFTSEGFVRSDLVPNLCIGHKNGGRIGFTVLALEECPTTEQQWDLVSGQLRNRATGHCIDSLHSGGGTHWWQLVVQDCVEDKASQQWEQVHRS